MSAQVFFGGGSQTRTDERFPDMDRTQVRGARIRGSMHHVSYWHSWTIWLRGGATNLIYSLRRRGSVS